MEELSNTMDFQVGRDRLVDRSKNFLNSTARWRAVSWWMAIPLARFRAAYKSIVP